MADDPNEDTWLYGSSNPEPPEDANAVIDSAKKNTADGSDEIDKKDESVQQEEKKV